MRRATRSRQTTRTVLCVILLTGSIIFARPSAADSWRLARGPSSVEFSVGHLIFTEVEGRFTRFEGRVDCPGGDFSEASVEATIEVASVYTGHTDRDRELQTEVFFDSERYPEMRFVSRSVERTGPSRYRLAGELTLRGITREVEFEAVYRGERATATGLRRDFVASGSINRSDYGLEWNDTWMGRALVGETVEIKLAIALVR